MCAADISELFALSDKGGSRLGGVGVETERNEGRRERERDAERAVTGNLSAAAAAAAATVRSVVVPCQTADGKWPRCGRGVELLQAAPTFIQDACPGPCP